MYLVKKNIELRRINYMVCCAHHKISHQGGCRTLPATSDRSQKGANCGCVAFWSTKTAAGGDISLALSQTLTLTCGFCPE